MKQIVVRIMALVMCALFAHAADKPNVLLIISDDHAAYVTGAYGNAKVSTPNIDRLAQEGMLFERAYCTTPVCTASRQSFLTGRYPRSIGVTQLRTALPEEVPTMADAFAAAGYRTAAIGKMHFNSKATHGFGLLLDAPDHDRAIAARGALPLPEGVPTLGAWKPFKTPAREWLNADYLPYPAMEADMQGQYFVEEAEKFMAEESELPFFLMLSFYTPHSPFHFPVEYNKRKEAAGFDPPMPGPEDEWQIPEIFKPLTRADKQGINAAYYTSVEYLDHNVGLALHALKASGQLDNTIIMYFGDHGYFLGQHGRIEKHSLYEEAVRVPLIVRYPKTVKAKQRSDAQVLLHDIFPTLGELCELSLPVKMNGVSFADVLRGGTEEHRNFVCIEYAENEEAMVRDKRWKLIYGSGKRVRQDGYKTDNPTPGRYVLLYDTQEDPQEMRNLAKEPAHAELVQDMLQKLLGHLEQSARLPKQQLESGDLFARLDAAVQPHDIE